MTVICIDPGHGDRDVGAVGQRGSYERDLVLSIALKLTELLTHCGINVILTRQTNTPGFPQNIRKNLQLRCDIANKARAAFFISIHIDASSNRLARGITTYILKRGREAEKLGSLIQQKLIAETGAPNRGVREANYHVLRNTKMPSVLLELGFISNEQDEKLLSSVEYQWHCATAIAKALCEYLGVDFMDKNTPDSWAKESWEWGKKNSITDGQRPRDVMTRQEMVTMLHRYHQRKGAIK